MPSSRKEVPRGRRSYDKRNVRALFFPNNQAESVSLSVPTLQPKAPVQPSYPLVEAAFGSRLFIHDSRVIIKHLQQTIIFKIFYTRHAYQPINSALATLDAQVMWQGQFLAMLIGKRHLNRVVSFRNEDIFFAKMAILSFVREANKRKVPPPRLLIRV